MAKKKKTDTPQFNEEKPMTLKDQLESDLVEKLNQAKKQLEEKEKQKEKERKAQLERERKQREKNMSFEELLEKYGDKGSKY